MTAMGHERRRRHAGFTLLEVMVALAIFSIGMMAMMPLFATASWGSRGGRELTRATLLARSYIDRIRNTPYGLIGPCSPSCAPVAAEVAANGPFAVTWTVTWVNGTEYPPFRIPPQPAPLLDTKRITVTVTCATCARQNLRVRMETLVSARS